MRGGGCGEVREGVGRECGEGGCGERVMWGEGVEGRRMGRSAGKQNRISPVSWMCPDWCEA